MSEEDVVGDDILVGVEIDIHIHVVEGGSRVVGTSVLAGGDEMVVHNRDMLDIEHSQQNGSATVQIIVVESHERGFLDIDTLAETIVEGGILHDALRLLRVRATL